MRVKKMSEKNVIITGSGTGIGREIALEFAREGANVIFHYSHSADGAKSGVEEAKKLGVKSALIQADFSKLDDVLKLGDEAIAFLGKIDILVNNAGISFNKPFLKVEPEQFTKMYDVNIRAQFFLTQKIVKNMIEHGKGGAICNITSVHGVSGAPEHSVYAGTKGAIIAYTRSLAVELAHKGIRVNAIAPGCIPVENYKKDFVNYNAQEFENIVKDKIPLGRSGKPLEIAKLALFLCSDEAEFIIGQTIIADGGTTSLMSLISDFRNESSAHFGANYL
jgi:NAD(P)-dependent dehydrogenase (short-subunit alcohol dehydrogenase family)